MNGTSITEIPDAIFNYKLLKTLVLPKHKKLLKKRVKLIRKHIPDVKVKWQG
jgi:hypothetical protein